jgi:hypothetical protein
MVTEDLVVAAAAAEVASRRMKQLKNAQVMLHLYWFLW